MMELKVTIIKLIASFKVLPGDSMDKLRFKTDLVIRPDNGIPIKLVERIWVINQTEQIFRRIFPIWGIPL